MSIRTRQEILDILHRAGLYHLIEGHESELPDQLDTERDREILDRLGIYRGDIFEALSSSP